MRMLVLGLWAAILTTGLVAARAQACSQFPQPPLPTATIVLQVKDTAYPLTVEVAATELEKACGLMGRPRLEDGRGMLFDMRPAGPAFFWMDNTPGALDILFADADGSIVHIEHEAVPFSRRLRGTRKPVAAVLELSAGTAERLGISLGDRIGLPWDR